VTQSSAALGYAPDRAIRARLNAILIDGLILGVITRLALGGVDDFGTAALVALVLQFAYFFVQEATGARTLGKRRTNIRVVQLDGSPPTLGQVAIRNALRIFDALPLLYASGLVAVMWSGPGLRQRLGDKVAGTAVILEPGGKSHRTAGWLLPTLTVASVLVSTLIYGVLYREYRTPSVGENSLAPSPVPGFAGDNSQPPGEGTYTAEAQLNGQQLLDPATHKPMVRSWSISKTCTSGRACTYEIVRDVPGEGSERGQLTPAADGWHVVFPTQAFRATCPGSSTVVTVRRRAAFVVHFDPGGRTAQAHETSAFQAVCGAFARRTDWTASLPTF
jgi:uncharacterized RDD family membrane protein YckC